MHVRPKKSLGQHFLTDGNIARKIVSAIPAEPKTLLEIGPGTGMLTKIILESNIFEPVFIETDLESVEFLSANFPGIEEKIMHGDFLRIDLKSFIPDHYQIVGNLPYNISSQIFFRMLEDRDRLHSAVVMIQKEVAERISSGPGNKTYGILSVLLQTWFDIDYLFTVSEKVFHPQPKVKSAVIKLSRNRVMDIGCDPVFYFKLVKTAFNQRRKTLRNALKPLLSEKDTSAITDVLSKRAEQLSIQEFISLAKYLENQKSTIVN
ncbi:MAG: 16S rRNA (adenine(1518)-N(6)/adenine(1519)-N(6))-dimethyltransferase RsmA [Bacteroidetes bacterium]|nr:16S rRNA (adenine(1518)-N(6)/adenine(1519)-N(6))-dimethyltransferase RsmA [Bacteroidota bacterium]